MKSLKIHVSVFPVKFFPTLDLLEFEHLAGVDLLEFEDLAHIHPRAACKALCSV